MVLELALSDHTSTLAVAGISAVASIVTAWIAARAGKRSKDVHDIVERRNNNDTPELHPHRRADDEDAP